MVKFSVYLNRHVFIMHIVKIAFYYIGASSGIGEGTAVHFAKLGSRLSLAGRSVENLTRVASLCREQGLSENDVS